MRHKYSRGVGGGNRPLISSHPLRSHLSDEFDIGNFKSGLCRLFEEQNIHQLGKGQREEEKYKVIYAEYSDYALARYNNSFFNSSKS